jgi:hypothetical protein
MFMKPATVDILIEKAHFEPRIAIAVAEAMDEAIETKKSAAQWVSAPVLTATVELFDSKWSARLAETRSDILRHLYSAILGQFVILVGLCCFFVSHLK